MKCAVKVTFVEHVPTVGSAWADTATGAVPVVADDTGDAGVADVGAVDAVGLGVGPRDGSPVGAPVAGALATAPIS